MIGDANEAFRMVIGTAAMVYIVARALNRMHAKSGLVRWRLLRRTLWDGFILDREIWKRQEVSPEGGALKYIVKSLFFFLYLVVLVAVAGAGVGQIAGVFTGWLSLTLIILYALALVLILANKASANFFFRHSRLAVAMTWAIRINPSLPNQFFSCAQTDNRTVYVFTETSHTLEVWKKQQSALASASHLTISLIEQDRPGVIKITCYPPGADIMPDGAFVTKSDGGLVRIKNDTAANQREVYFLYDRNYIDDAGRRGRIKIGGGKTFDRLRAGSTWVIEMEPLGIFVETSDFNEVSLRRKFSKHRIKSSHRDAGGEWFYDDQEIRDAIEVRKAQLTTIT